MEKKYPKNLSGALRIIHNKFAIPNIAIIALAIMMILGMSACGSAGNPSSPKLPKPLLELSGTIDISPNSGVTIGTPLTANYTGTESVTYRWKKDETTISTNGKNFTPYEAGSYTVTVGANGFKDKTSQTVIVTVIDEPSPGLTFTLNDTGTAYLVSKGTITDTAVVIPAKHEGLPVTGIADNGFANYSMTSIGIPDSVTSIGSGAFSGCTGLASIALPDSVMSIGIGAFSDCSGLTSITLPFTGETWDGTTPNTHFGYIFGASNATDQNSSLPAKLKTVTLTSGTSIADNAFSGCGLTSITIPASVISIGSGAFSDCTLLTSFTIPAEVKSIGNDAFSGCFNLASITIPAKVESIGNDAFSGCSSLTSITIPGSVTEIGSGAFSGCALTSITIPASVTNIGSGAFSDCNTLASISIPFVGQDGTVNPYFGYIFGAATNTDQKKSIPASLKTVTITGGNSIAQYAFYNCDGLTNITIPSSVTGIAMGAFAGCNGLTSITIPFVGQYLDGSGVTYFGHIFGVGAGNNVTNTLKKVIVTGGKTIAGNAFTNASTITDIILPDSVTSIVKDAFSNCYGLESITIPTGLKSIGASTFDKCGKLAKVYYRGDASVWNTPTLPVGGTNGGLNTATIYSYSETDPGTGGKYWRFVDGVPAIW